MAKKKSSVKVRPNIVSVNLSPEAKQNLDNLCDARGMTIKTLLGRLIVWVCTQDMTEQSIVFGLIEDRDAKVVRASRKKTSKSA
jgi:hypothetical protein